jgi:GNAT superfamily N-acetyltransferase
MTPSTILLTAFRAEHLAGAACLSQQANWPHRLEDWQMALGLSTGIVAMDANATRVLGTALMTPYKQDVATINMVLVDEAARGHGLGRKLMEEVIALAGSRALRLIATRDGLPLYQKLGFRETGTIAQHQGHVVRVAPPANVRPAEPHEISAIIDLDRSAGGADREDLLHAFAKVGRLAVLSAGQKIAGFAALRTFGKGQVIGPVVAANEENGKALLAYFMAAREGQFVRVDIAETPQLAPWLTDKGLVRVDDGIAMQRPVVPRSSGGPLTTFALASQAFG